jgi:hypothetical protein
VANLSGPLDLQAPGIRDTSDKRLECKLALLLEGLFAACGGVVLGAPKAVKHDRRSGAGQQQQEQ